MTLIDVREPMNFALYPLLIVDPIDRTDLLDRFEALRRLQSATDHESFVPAEVKVPSRSRKVSDTERLVAYLENGEKSLNKESKPTFRPGSTCWASRGFFDYHPHYSNSISTGTYYAGTVILQIDGRGKFNAMVQWLPHERVSEDYFWNLRRFMQGEIDKI